MLKAELHSHVNEDPKDKNWIKHSAQELVDEAIRQKFEVLAITCHNKVYQNKKLQKYAAKQGLLLIFGVERDIEHKHVLIYKITPEEADSIHSFADLEKLKNKKKVFIIAAHPCYPGPSSLGNKIYQYPELFDAWEHSFLHTRFWNPNLKMLQKAREINKPVVGNSDIHLLKDLGRTYTLIDAAKNEEAIFQAIIENKVQIVTSPLSGYEFFRIACKAITSAIRHRITKIALNLLTKVRGI